MIVLGLNHGELNSSAALTIDGRIVAAAPEERFSRQKKTRAFPTAAVRYCLEEAGLSSLSDCDAVAQSWNPGAAWIKYNPLISEFRVRREDNFYAVSDHLLGFLDRRPPEWVRLDSSEESDLPPVYHIQHHRTHAANGFYLSGFEEAAVLTADWRGELETTTMGVGRNTKLETLATQSLPHSLGLFYATFTELLGYRPDNDEWKVMALSAFDVDCGRHSQAIRETVRLLDNGMFELDQRFFKGTMTDQPKLYTPALVEALGGREGDPGAEPDEWYYSVARAMQMVAEEVAIHMLNHLHASTGLSKVVLSGGFFMNSVLNGKVTDLTPFDEVFISHSPADVGNSIGAALYVTHHVNGVQRENEFATSYLGPSYSDEEIQTSLERRQICYQKVSNPEEMVADLLSQGSIVAVLNGRMEFGERALGNRSILADPRSPDMMHRVNAMIKYREAYRPFAPAILAERATDYFEVDTGFESNYMERVVSIRPEVRADIPAVTHVDGSGRIQTVNRSHNPDFHSLISAFEARTGIPIVLNTSFNINGEPIVSSPDDALNTFFNSGLRHLMLGRFLVQKE